MTNAPVNKFLVVLAVFAGVSLRYPSAIAQPVTPPGLRSVAHNATMTGTGKTADPLKYALALSVKDYATCDGVANDHTGLQAALDAAPGKKLVFPSGATCTDSTGPVSITANTTIEIQRGARWLKNYDAGGGTTLSYIQTKSLSVPTKQNNIRIYGEGTVGCASASQGGNIFGLYGDRIKLDNFTIDTYGGGSNKGRAIIISGDDDRISGLDIVNPQHAIGAGGIRVVGGNGFVAVGNHVESGDDALQFVPVAPGADPLANQTIANGLYIGNTGVSYAARFISVGLNENVHTGTMTASIKNVGFVGNKGTGGNRVMVIDNQDSSGDIDGVYLADTVLTIGATPSPSSEVTISQEATATGAVTNVVVHKLRIIAPVKIPLLVSGPNVSRVTLEDIDIDAPTTTVASLEVDEGQEISVVRPRLRGVSGAYVISVGTTGLTVDHFALIDGHITSIYNSFAGLRLANCTWPRIVGTRFVEQTANDTALAVSSANTTDRLDIGHIETDGLVTASPISDAGSNTTRWGNSSLNTVVANTKFSGTILSRTPVTLAAASTLSTGLVGNIFMISAGTGTIDTIVVGAGEMLTLRFTGVVTVNDLHHGGNISLTGGADLAATSGTILTLVGDATSWYEISRRTP